MSAFRRIFWVGVVLQVLGGRVEVNSSPERFVIVWRLRRIFSEERPSGLRGQKALSIPEENPCRAVRHGFVLPELIRYREFGQGAERKDCSSAEPAEQFDVHPDQITDWKGRLAEGAAAVFGEDRADEQAKIGELALANDFLESALVKAGLLSAKR